MTFEERLQVAANEFYDSSEEMEVEAVAISDEIIFKWTQESLLEAFIAGAKWAKKYSPKYERSAAHSIEL